MVTGALRCFVDQAVRGDPIRRNATLSCQKLGKLGKSDKLFARRAGFGKIANQTDADPVFVVVIAGGLAMRPGLLLVPARTDFDHTVRGPRPVADHEVIAQFVPALVAMKTVERPRVPGSGRTVMNDDCRPAGADLPTRRIPGRSRVSRGGGTRRWRRSGSRGVIGRAVRHRAQRNRLGTPRGWRRLVPRLVTPVEKERHRHRHRRCGREP